jgi:hypothetical protein
MQLSHVTAFGLRLTANVLLDLFLYVHHVLLSGCAHEIIRRSIARKAVLQVRWRPNETIRSGEALSFTVRRLAITVLESMV